MPLTEVERASPHCPMQALWLRPHPGGGQTLGFLNAAHDESYPVLSGLQQDLHLKADGSLSPHKQEGCPEGNLHGSDGGGTGRCTTRLDVCITAYWTASYAGTDRVVRLNLSCDPIHVRYLQPRAPMPE